MKQSKIDIKYMRMALRLARKGIGAVSPNPPVGAVLVKNDRVIGKGYHGYYGGPHAEIVALNACSEDSKGATMYVTLEPCSTFGKTPACTDALINNGIKRVVIAYTDQNPDHNGRGLSILKKTGIEVTEKVCFSKAEKLYEYFSWYIKNKRPYVILKTAMSLDGKIATKTGDSKWISGEKSRRSVHKLRREVDAVMVGVNTVKIDNPRLSSRLSEKNIVHPLKIVLDTRGEIPLKCELLNKENSHKTLVVVSKNIPDSIKESIEATGAAVLTVSEKNKRIDLTQTIELLAGSGITSILVESGGELAASTLREKLVNKVHYYYAPKVIGGKTAPTAVGGSGIEKISDSIELKINKIKKIGVDILVIATPCDMPSALCVSEANTERSEE